MIQKKKIILAALFCLTAFSSLAYALPEGESVVSGSASFDYDTTNELNINTSSDKLIVNWNGFDTTANETVRFNQPSSGAIALNRITGANPTNFMGSLIANGRIFVINPNGILFGAGSHVDTRGLVASTMDISNQNFLNGNYNFYKSGTNNASITNQGNITVTNGGFICLLSQAVDNQGAISANTGTVVLASGENMTLALDDLNDISVVIDEPVKAGVFDINGNKINSAIQNSGSIAANGGKILLTAKALNSVFDYSINNTGIIQANSLVNNDGVVELTAAGAPAINTGKIEAGRIYIKVDNADFTNKGVINANGYEGNPDGGEIFINAVNLLQAGSITANAYNGGSAGLIKLISEQSTILESGSTTEAKGSGAVGNGGRILINSTNGNTYVYPNAIIDVSAGTEQGDGGFIEISAYGRLDFYGTLSGRAPPGYKPGLAILDPTTAAIGAPFDAPPDVYGTFINIDTYVWATNNIFIVGNVTLADGVHLYLLADHASATPGDWHDGIGAIFNTAGWQISAAPGDTTYLYLYAGSGIGTIVNPIITNQIKHVSAYNTGASGDIAITAFGGLVVSRIENYSPAGLVEIIVAGGDLFINGWIFSASDVYISATDGSIIGSGMAIAGKIIAQRAYLQASNSIYGNYYIGSSFLATRVSYIEAFAGNDIRIYNADAAAVYLGNIQSANASVYIAAGGDINVDYVSALGSVTLESLGGAILDGNGPANNIISATVVLRAVNGIGTIADPIETQISGLLSAFNTASGDIVITNDGSLDIFRIENPAGIVNLTANGNIRIICWIIASDAYLTALNGSIIGLALPGTKIQAANIYLWASDSIYGTYNPAGLRFSGTGFLTTDTSYIEAVAGNDIKIYATGAVKLGDIRSTNASAYIAANGDIKLDYISAPGSVTLESLTGSIIGSGLHNPEIKTAYLYLSAPNGQITGSAPFSYYAHARIGYIFGINSTPLFVESGYIEAVAGSSISIYAVNVPETTFNVISGILADLIADNNINVDFIQAPSFIALVSLYGSIKGLNNNPLSGDIQQTSYLWIWAIHGSIDGSYFGTHATGALTANVARIVALAKDDIIIHNFNPNDVYVEFIQTGFSGGSGRVIFESRNDLNIQYAYSPVSVLMASFDGAIVALDNGPNPNIESRDLYLYAATGIGSGDALETKITNLWAYNTTSGNIELVNSGDLYANSVVNLAPTGAVDLTAHSDIYVGYISAPDSVTLEASGSIKSIIVDGIADIVSSTINLIGNFGIGTAFASPLEVTATRAINADSSFSNADIFIKNIGSVPVKIAATGGAINILANGLIYLGDITGVNGIYIRTTSGNIIFRGPVVSTNSDVYIISDLGSVFADTLAGVDHITAKGNIYITVPNGTIGVLSGPDFRVIADGFLILNIGGKVVLTSGILAGIVKETYIFNPVNYPSPLYPPGNVYFNGVRIWPSRDTFSISQAYGAFFHGSAPPYLEQIARYQLPGFDINGPMFTPVFFYHPLTVSDMSAFSEFILEEGAYEYLDGVLNMRGEHDALLSILEELRKKRKNIIK